MKSILLIDDEENILETASDDLRGQGSVCLKPTIVLVASAKARPKFWLDDK